jgi:hypothetical protein
MCGIGGADALIHKETAPPNRFGGAAVAGALKNSSAKSEADRHLIPQEKTKRLDTNAFRIKLPLRARFSCFAPQPAARI